MFPPEPSVTKRLQYHDRRPEGAPDVLSARKSSPVLHSRWAQRVVEPLRRRPHHRLYSPVLLGVQCALRPAASVCPEHCSWGRESALRLDDWHARIQAYPSHLREGHPAQPAAASGFLWATLTVRVPPVCRLVLGAALVGGWSESVARVH